MKKLLTSLVLTVLGFVSSFAAPLELIDGLIVQDNDVDSTFQELNIGPGNYFCFWDGDELLGFTMCSFEAFKGNVKAYIKAQERGIKEGNGKKIKIEKRPDFENPDGVTISCYTFSYTLEDTPINQCFYFLPKEGGFLNMVVTPAGEHSLSEFLERADAVMSTAVIVEG